VRWRRGSQPAELEFECEIPEGTRATLSLPFTGKEPVLLFDERTLSGSQLRLQGPYAVTEIGQGRHRGRL